MPRDAMPAPPVEEAPEAPLSDRDLARYRSELLDPESWADILGTFGRTTRLAVALTDLDGNILGSCHNPQPVWARLRAGAQTGAGCPFCLLPQPRCRALDDALISGDATFAQDPTGLAHAAIPLFLGNQRLGALIAGQCFSQYPQPLALQRVAKQFGVPTQEVWDSAVRQVPVSRATLRLYCDLLGALGRAFLRQRYAAILSRNLLQANERYRLMIEESKDRALLTVDGKGSVTSWNPGAERLFGYTEPEMAGTSFSRLFTPDDIRSGVPSREIQRVAQSGWIEDEGWHVRKDGTSFLSETVMARLGEGESMEYGFLLRDVTETRKAAEVSLQAQKLESIGVLAGGIAHDFNNLLTGILGNLSLAMVDLPPGDTARPLLDLAERSSLKAAALIRQLLAYAGKGAVCVTRFDLSNLVSEMLPLIQTSIPKAVQLDLSLPADLPWIIADSSEIQQIVMNLVINAAESVGPAGGEVRVSTGPAICNPGEQNQSDGVYFEVSDTGCGMDEPTKKRIFDPFFTTKFTGRGLGLAAVAGIVRRLKVSMEVESALGKGTTFRIVFRGVPAQLTAAKTTVKAADSDFMGVILVVDDDANVRGLVRAVLERHGYSVLTAENGQVAVETFRKNSDTIAAVVMDFTMPVMSGQDAFLLMNEIRPDIPVIISTGFSESDVRDQFTGALGGVIQKPYTVAQLREKIAEVLTFRNLAKMRSHAASGH
jgi:PAS domain S-box-containing protein